MTHRPKEGNTMGELLIWWLNPSDTERVQRLAVRREDCFANWPDYLGKQLTSRSGRAGRGRLWVADKFGEVSNSNEWNPENPACEIADDCGGIVIAEVDYDHVASLPGFVTRLDMSIYARSRDDARVDIGSVTLTISLEERDNICSALRFMANDTGNKSWADKFAASFRLLAHKVSEADHTTALQRAQSGVAVAEAQARVIANSLAVKEDWSIGSQMWMAARLGAFKALTAPSRDSTAREE